MDVASFGGEGVDGTPTPRRQAEIGIDVVLVSGGIVPEPGVLADAGVAAR